MKSIISLVVVAALTFIGSASAQDESPSPATEEKASTTVQETPAATASPETRPTATPKEEAAAISPAVQKKETAATQKKAAAAPAKSASPSAAPTAKKMSVEATLKGNENQWEAAIAKHDAAIVESMLANDFIGVSSRPGAKVQNRRGLLAEMRGDKDTYTSTKNEKLDVHMYGGGVAVVVGTAREKGTGNDGKAFDRTYRFTDTWVDRGGKWECVASQATLVGQR